MMRNAWIPWGQWLAVITMTAEHLARFVLPDAWGLAPWAILVGRIALPLFAAMVAWHALHNTRDPQGYAFRLLVIAMVAQLPYAIALDVERLNVVFTLVLGMMIALPLVRSGFDSLVYASGALVFGLMTAPAIEYGLPGLALVPAFVLAFHPCHPRWRPLLVAPVLVVAFHLNASASGSLVALAAVSGLLVLLVVRSGRIAVQLPAMPRALWLTWYPLHFAFIAAFAWAMNLH